MRQWSATLLSRIPEFWQEKNRRGSPWRRQPGLSGCFAKSGAWSKQPKTLILKFQGKGTSVRLALTQQRRIVRRVPGTKSGGSQREKIPTFFSPPQNVAKIYADYFFSKLITRSGTWELHINISKSGPLLPSHYLHKLCFSQDGVQESYLLQLGFIGFFMVKT